MAETLMTDTPPTNSGAPATAAPAAAADLAAPAAAAAPATAPADPAATVAEAAEAKTGAPEVYEFKAPEGQELDAEFIKSFSETAKELNLTQEAAQTMIDKISPVIEKQQMAKIEAVRNEWTESSKIDKEFGGEKLQENLAIAKTALDKFGTPELKELINKSGLGNNPEVIRFFYRAGKAISSDTFVGGHKDGKNAPKSMNDYADKLYS